MKKILVIGGACQGKTEWVRTTFPEYKNISVEDLLTENREGRTKGFICLNQFHLCMRQWMKEDKNYEEALNFIVSNPSWLIIADEVGNGIVPIDKFERK